MGVAGLAIAWFRAGHVYPGLSPLAGGFTALAGVLFALLSGLYLVKAIRFPGAVRAEFNHPVRLHFFPAISISALLLSIATTEVMPNLAHGLLLAGAGAHLVMTLTVLSQWINGSHFQPPHLNPAWFIPIVGNILVPIPAVAFGYVEAGWFFFAIGVVFWPVLLTLIVHRLLFQPELPARMMPTLFILIPPPAIGFLSYLKLSGGIDGFARILYFTAVFMTLLACSQLPRLARLPFFISWWAYSFPLAAITVATFAMHERTGQALYLCAALVLLAIATVVILGLLARTALAAARRQICIPE